MIERRPMKRRDRNFKIKRMVAYDLETTNIKEGTPKVKYITAYDGDRLLSKQVNNIKQLHDCLVKELLKDELSGYRFIAWNANHYDIYFIVMALLEDERFLLRPYLNRKNMMRGLRVIRKLDKPLVGKPYEKDENGKTIRWQFSNGSIRMQRVITESNINWEFLDGMAMVTAAPMKLEKFLKIFAPEHMKLTSNIDFSKEEFDSKNKKHIAYAEQDSIGLYHGMLKVESILLKHFNATLQPTIGNLGIKLLTSNLPDDVLCWLPPMEVEDIIRNYVFRGGFVWCAKKYDGKVWKYDLNQAYAAAMRECWLPCGSMVECGDYDPKALAAIYRVRGKKKNNIIPFYYTNDTGKRSYGFDEIEWTWLTSVEVHQLQREKWQLEFEGGYEWLEAFTLPEYVDRLEKLRQSDKDGPSGALGTIVKSIGNSSYGKTVEQLSGMDIVISLKKPDGYSCFEPETELGSLMWFKITSPVPRDYHQPQIGAFITAHVRMVVRRAALKGGKDWLYSDTDCCMFSKPVKLDIDSSRYGAWKLESAGDLHLIIDKKVYLKRGGEKKAKGLNINSLEESDFENWFNGDPPAQAQLQRNSLLKVMAGNEMFTIRKKVGSVKGLSKEQIKSKIEAL